MPVSPEYCKLCTSMQYLSFRLNSAFADLFLCFTGFFFMLDA